MDHFPFGTCKLIEAPMAVPVSLSVSVAVSYLVNLTNPGDTEAVSITGSFTANREAWQADYNDLDPDSFAFGTDECWCPRLQFESYDQTEMPPFSPGPGVISYYLGEGDATQTTTTTISGVPTVVITMGKIRFWIFVVDDFGGLRNLQLVAQLTTPYGPTSATDFFGVTPSTWAELVTDSPFVVVDSTPGTGSATWTYVGM